MRILDRGTTSIQVGAGVEGVVLGGLGCVFVFVCGGGGETNMDEPSHAHTSPQQDTVSIVLFNVLPSMIDIIVACTYLAGR